MKVKSILYGALLSLVAGPAFAGLAIEPLFSTDDVTQLIDDGAEGLIDRGATPDGYLGVGDTLYGTIEFLVVRDFDGGTINDTTIGGGTSYNELTAAYATKVQSLTITPTTANPLGDPDGSCLADPSCSVAGAVLTGDETAIYVFEPDPAFNTIFNTTDGITDTMIAVYEDPLGNFLIGDNATDIATATDGVLRMLLGMDGSDADEQWTSLGSSNPESGFILALDTELAGFNVDLSILFESFNGEFGQVDATDPIALPGGVALDDGLIDLQFSGSVQAFNSFGNGFPLQVQTTAVINYDAIPEPNAAALLGLGLGLFGLVAARRRRNGQNF